MSNGSYMPTCTSFWRKCLWVDVDFHVNLSNVNVLRPMFVGKNNVKTLICTPLIPVTILSLGTLSFDLGTLSFRATFWQLLSWNWQTGWFTEARGFQRSYVLDPQTGTKAAATGTCAPATNTLKEGCVSRQTGGQTGSAWACQNHLKTLQKYLSVCWENTLNF